MNGQPEMVTVFRSMEMDAKQDCEATADVLAADGLSPVVLDDKAPGVPDGVHEVRVPADQQGRAELLLAALPPLEDVEAGDPSSHLDLSEPIFSSRGSSTAEFEATEIKTLLEANNIAAVVVGDSVLPNLPFEVRVAKEDVERAQELIKDQTDGGPAAAEQAELEGEQAAGAGETATERR
jgi:Putative prokaryotic signal transducing protein